MAIDQESLSKVRSYAESLKGEERTNFISKFQALKDDESISKLASRLPDSSKKEPTMIDNAVKAVVEPAQEIARGFGYQGADMLGNLDALTKAGTELTGIPRSGTFGEMAKSGYEASNAIPQTDMNQLDKNMYQTVGRLPGMAMEFEMGGKMLKPLKVPAAITAAFGDIPAARTLTNAVTIGVQSAVNEFRNSDSFTKAANSFASGTTATLGLGMAAELGPKAIELGKTMGKNAAKAFLKAVTGDEKFAESFVQDPHRFNLNPFSKVNSLKDIEADNTAKINDIKNEYNSNVSDMKVQNAEKKAALSSELDKEYYSLKNNNKDIQRAVVEKGKVDVDKVNAASKQSFDNTVNLIHTGLLDDVNNAVAKVDAIKQASGKQVEQAVENVTNKDPFSSVGAFNYLNKFKEVANRNGYDLVGGKVVPAYGMGTADEKTLLVLQNNLDDIKSVVNGNNIPLGFAQAKKKLWQDLGYKGQEKANQVMQQLSGALNPVNMADNIYGKNIAPEINALKTANAEFSNNIPKYQEAIKNFTRLDASGNPVADTQKVLNAVKNRDLGMLKQMAKADSLLPPEDRLLPKAQEAVKKMNIAEDLRTAHIKLAKRKASEQLTELKQNISQKEFQVRQANKAERFSEGQRLQQNLNQMKTVDLAKMQKTIENLNGEIEFTRQQELARSFSPPGGRKTLQFGTLASMAGNMAVNPGMAVASGAGTLALSPKVASGAVKAGAKVAGGTAELLKALLDKVNQGVSKLY